MSENHPRSKESKNRRRAATRVVAGALALAAAFGVGTYVGRSSDGPKQAPVAEAPEAGTSPEIIVQDATRQDAAAIVRAVGNLLKESGGQSVYNGEQYDNYGENDAPMPGKPGLQVVRNQAEHMLQVAVSDTSRENQLTLHMYVSADDSVMQMPLDARTVTTGVAPGNLEVVSLTRGRPDGSVETILYEDSNGHLAAGDPANSHPLTLAEAQMAAADTLKVLQQVAGELNEQLPDEVVQELSQ